MAYLFVFKDREGNVHRSQTWHPRVPRNSTTTLLSRESHRTADTQEHGKVKQMCFLIHKYVPWLFMMEEKGQRVKADEWAVTQESACMSYVYGRSLWLHISMKWKPGHGACQTCLTWCRNISACVEETKEELQKGKWGGWAGGAADRD